MKKRLTSSLCQGLLLAAALLGVPAASAGPDGSQALRARYTAMQEELRASPFGRPLVLDSVETPNRLKGDVYAVVEYPFATVSAELANPERWCDALLLHINTKYCRATATPEGSTLRMQVGKKTPQELPGTTRLDFTFATASATPDYSRYLLSAKDGPMGTSDYRIELEVVALSAKTSFLHLTYAYGVSLVGRMAMQTYLGTVGSDKVGFTVAGQRENGQPDYVGGVRGLLERNTMRYYLAIDSLLASAQVAPAQRQEKRLQRWFDAVERYPRQLHEMDQAEYLQMKRAEYQRQQTVE